MAKSKPIGVRIDEDRLADIKEREGLKTVQQVVTFLIDKYFQDIEDKVKSVILESKKDFTDEKPKPSKKWKIPESVPKMPEGLSYIQQLKWKAEQKQKSQS